MNLKLKGAVQLISVAALALAGSVVTSGAAHAQAPPAAPSGVGVTTTAANTFLITWQDNSSDESGFEVSDGISSRMTGPNARADNWHVNPGTYKCFHVRAFNSFGQSAWIPSSSPYYVCGTTQG